MGSVISTIPTSSLTQVCTRDSDCHTIKGRALSDSFKKATCCLKTTLSQKGTTSNDEYSIKNNGSILGYPVNALDSSKTCF